ncbi:MAG: pentapeptide repeat-containing protein [Rufibacter sp.]
MMKKNLLLLLSVLLLPALANAQTTVPAAEIIAKINRGEAVRYSNATITGVLDLTQLINKALKEKKGGKKENNGKEYNSTVTAPLVFSNCTFKEDVLAYYNPSNPDGKGNLEQLSNMNGVDEVYNANFDQEVKFENCVFEKQSAFKYSVFKGNVSFAGSTFQEEALFKYSKFNAQVNFNQAKFNENANFKYVRFPEKANFSGAQIQGEGDFKYASFPEGADFQNVLFKGLANFKYANLEEPTQWQGAKFEGGRDIKYARLNKEAMGAANSR